MKKDFGLESYAYNQLLQVAIHEKLAFVSLEASFLSMSRQHPVAVHEKLSFVSLEASFLSMSRQHPNKPIFSHDSMQK
jgi:hypothetical protein